MITVAIALGFALSLAPIPHQVQGEVGPEPLSQLQISLAEAVSPSVQAETCWREGIDHYRARQYAAALASWQQALRLYQQSGNQAGQLQTTEAIALAYEQLQDYPQAIAAYQQQLSLATALGDVMAQANAYANLGNNYRTLGDYRRALAAHQRSLALRQALGDQAGAAKVLANLGNVYAELGQYDRAIQLHRDSLEIARQRGDRSSMAISLNSLGLLYASQGDYGAAQQQYAESLAIAEQLSDQRLTADVLNNLGALHHVQGDYATALDYYQQGLQTAQAIDDRALEAATLASLGLVYSSQQQYEKALQQQAASWQLAQEISDRQLMALALSNWGDTLWQSGDLAAAEAKLRAALTWLDELRADLTDAERVSLFDTQLTTYNILIQVLVAQNRPAEALLAAEQGRARALVAQLSDQPQAAASDLTLDDLRRIAQTENATLVEYAIMPDDRYISHGKRLGQERSLFIWVVQPDGDIHFRQVDLRATPANLQEAVALSRQSLGTRSASIAVITPASIVDFSQQLQTLYQRLIAPIADLLPTDPTDRIIFIPQRELFLVPFAALQAPDGSYLIQHHTLLTAPAIQVVGLTAAPPESTPSASDVLVVGNPTMPPLPGLESGQTLPPLPGAAEEAIAIADLFHTTPLLGDEATETAVSDRLATAHLVHLATHGLLDYGIPNASGVRDAPGAVVLAASSTADGLLTATEISQMSLQADLVVLSACDTGRGDITGDGVIGLARSLTTAGVPSVIVSLWAVPDAPTASLMTTFYQQYRQHPDKAQALRQAMLTTMTHHRNPRDWAAFVLVGKP